MMLIADSGSTKTDWCVILDNTPIKRIGTKGLNPFFQSEEEIQQELTHSLLPQLPEGTIDSVYFYGAGCTPEKAPTLRRAIADSLPVVGNIKAYSDMLAAARGLCGREAGITCILGTGSNSCFYDGKEIVNHISPLGFILGDEGSGAVLGKLLVGDILKNQLSPAIKEVFLKQFDLTVPEIIDRVYRQPFPGPGLGVRCIGAITRDRLEAVRESDAILREEFAKNGLEGKVWQYFTVVPDIKSTGIIDGKRSFDWPVIIRAVNTVDAVTAEVAQLDFGMMQHIVDRITHEVSGVNRVLWDLTPKPTGTIEWE